MRDVPDLPTEDVPNVPNEGVSEHLPDVVDVPLIAAIVPITDQPGWSCQGIGTEEEFLKRFEQVATMHCCTKRELGFMLLHAERLGYGKLKTLVESDSWKRRHLPSYATCANARSVCKSIGLAGWHPALDYGHHRAVAALPADRQQHWLDKAEYDHIGPTKLVTLVADEPRKPREGKKRGRPAKPALTPVDAIVKRVQSAVDSGVDELEIHLAAKTLGSEDADHAANACDVLARHLAAVAGDLREEGKRLRRRQTAQTEIADQQLAAD